MTTVTLEEAQAKLVELVNSLGPGDVIVIVRDNHPVAQLAPATAPNRQPKFGTLKGVIEVISDDDEHLADFKEYMP